MCTFMGAQMGPNTCWATWIGLLWGGLINAIIALAVWDKNDPDKMEGVMKMNINWAGFLISLYLFVIFLGTTVLHTTPPEGQGRFSRQDAGVHEWTWGLLLGAIINIVVAWAIFDKTDAQTVKDAVGNTAIAGLLASIWVFMWWTTEIGGPRKDNPPDTKNIKYAFGLWMGALINFILALVWNPSPGDYMTDPLDAIDKQESAVRCIAIGWLLLGAYCQIHWIMYGFDICKATSCGCKKVEPSGDIA